MHLTVTLQTASLHCVPVSLSPCNLMAMHSPVNDSEPLDVCLQQLIEAWVGRGAWRQGLVATDRANTPATSRQFEWGSAIHGQIHACPGQKSGCIMTKIRTVGACYRWGCVIVEVLWYMLIDLFVFLHLVYFCHAVLCIVQSIPWRAVLDIHLDLCHICNYDVLQNLNSDYESNGESWTIWLLLQPWVIGVVSSVLVFGLALDISSTFCDGFMVQCAKLMWSKFLHLWFLLFDCFVCRQNVTCLKRFTRYWHYADVAEDIIIATLSVVS